MRPKPSTPYAGSVAPPHIILHIRSTRYSAPGTRTPGTPMCEAPSCWAPLVGLVAGERAALLTPEARKAQCLVVANLFLGQSDRVYRNGLHGDIRAVGVRHVTKECESGGYLDVSVKTNLTRLPLECFRIRPPVCMWRFCFGRSAALFICSHSLLASLLITHITERRFFVSRRRSTR